MPKNKDLQQALHINVTPSTPDHDESLKKLRQLEMQLAAEKQKVAQLRSQRLSGLSERGSQRLSGLPESGSCGIIMEHSDLVLKPSKPMQRINSLKSNSSMGSACMPMSTLADMDKTGTVQVFAERRDHEIFSQFNPRFSRRAGAGCGRTGSTISSSDVITHLKEQHGLQTNDPRLDSMWKELSMKPRLTFEEFVMVKDNCVLMDRALTDQLIIPDFASFSDSIKECYLETKPDLPDDGTIHPPPNGDVARYIPSLAKVDPSFYGVAVCSVDGQQYSVGDAQKAFCIQSTSKPLTYGMALELHGEEKVHSHVGCEPSGRNFNARSMLVKQQAPGEEVRVDAHGNPITSKGIPHNPCINAGAIMVSSLVKQEDAEDARFDYVMDVWKRLAGGRNIGFQNSTYMGERATADRNWCLGYMMKEEHAFPDAVDLVKTLESYFMYCSIEMDAEAMAIVAGTLANGGVCPVTGERVFQAKTVQRCLSIMQVAGMYDYSGEFALKMGFPCKSGVSGVLCIVIPGVCGIATFSPRLDHLGNSVKGIRFCHELNQRFPFHEFASLRGCHKGKDITVSSLTGDATNMREHQEHAGVDAGGNDDRRGVIGGGTPTSSASSRCNSSTTRRSSWELRSDGVQQHQESEEDLTQLWYAAASGELLILRQLAASGVDVNIADYDRRSALHLAASEGQVHAVRYLLALGADTSYTDRYGNRPLDDAVREGYEEVELVLRQHMGEMHGYMSGADDDDGAESGADEADGAGTDEATGTATARPSWSGAGLRLPSGSDDEEADVDGGIEEFTFEMLNSPVEHNHQQDQQKCLYQGNVRWLQLLLRSTSFVSRALLRPLPLNLPLPTTALEGATVTADSDQAPPNSNVPRVQLYGKMMRKADLVHMLNEQGISPGSLCNKSEVASSGSGSSSGSTPSSSSSSSLLTWNGSADYSLSAQLQSLPEFFNRKCFQQCCVDPLRNPTIIKCLTGSLAIPDFPNFTRKVREVFDATTTAPNTPVMATGGGSTLAMAGHAACEMCTVDGQHLELNSIGSGFGAGSSTGGVQWVQVQDLIRPVVYCLVLEQEEMRIARMRTATEKRDPGANPDDDGGSSGGDGSGKLGQKMNVHQYVGREPRPSDATEIELNPDGIPFNPFTAGGAIMTLALLQGDTQGEGGGEGGGETQAKLRAVQSLVERLQGGLPCRLNQSAFEAATLPCNGGGNQERCVTYMLKATGCMDQSIDEVENLKAHFMCHALETSTRGLAVLAATLAGGGVCPTSGERVLSPHVVKSCLSLMNTSGMGNVSGEFQFKVGVPSKCAQGNAGGMILMAVPNVLGVCYVPDVMSAQGCQKMNDTSHTASGLPFCEGLVERFAFHRHDSNNVNTTNKSTEDPTRRVVHWQDVKTTMGGTVTSHTTSTAVVTRMLSAASMGDLMSIKAMQAAGCSLECADYDMRTAGHLAAATGHLEVLRYFASQGVDLEKQDRWGGTPLDDAEHEGHREVANSLRMWLGMPEVDNASDDSGSGLREGGGLQACALG